MENPEENKPKKKPVTFRELGFNDDILEGLDSMGFTNATPVQAQAAPHIFNRHDVMAIAQTGTGKTAAFLLPTLDLLMDMDEGKTRCLIITPTRELAMQIDVQCEALGYYTQVSSVAVYGGGEGGSWDQQKKAITGGADILVATPGRLLSHIKMGYAKFKDIEFFILDEADRMLDMGFAKDLEDIRKALPKKVQTLMFSATMPPQIRKLSKAILNEPKEINIAISKPSEKILQAAYLVHDESKAQLVVELLKGKKNIKKTIIFSSTKKGVLNTYTALKKKGFEVAAVSSDLDQKAREQALKDFVNEKYKILVATDVLSRGIDIKDIQLVINYDVPPDPEDYIHRIGRTGRADSSGVALTFISEKDMFRFGKIEELLEKKINKLQNPDSVGKGPEYNPKMKFKKHTSKGKNHSRNKGKKPFKKK